MEKMEASNVTHHNKLLEYWETCDGRIGGTLADLSEKGLRICSHTEMPVGEELRIGIFFSLGDGFDECRILARITGKELCWKNGGRESYEYELELVDISKEDCLKLRDLLRIRQAEKLI